MKFSTGSFSKFFIFLTLHHLFPATVATLMNCSDTSRICTSFLAFESDPTNLRRLERMFDVVSGDLTFESSVNHFVYIRKNCSCDPKIGAYVTTTTYTVTDQRDFMNRVYNGLGYNSTRSGNFRVGSVASVRLFCGCSSGLWNYLLTYVMRDGDSVGSLASRFGVSMDSIEQVNRIPDPDDIVSGSVYYIPLNTVPGDPYPMNNSTTAPALAPKPPTDNLPANEPNHKVQLSYIWIISVIDNYVFEPEKPVVFTYEEVMTATDGFSGTNLLGHGAYGSVYYGILREQEVAIKRMTTGKSKEFMEEMKILCKVHHANLVELLGYAATSDELFLIYEYAQKGSLRSHLHDPHNKGKTPFSWMMRVQIALDAASGLEYIHEHTKTHYVHRDMRTSNILLDSTFRAKISNFGLSKLVGTDHEAESSTSTRVVGTYGYLAPEYLSEGHATSKSDVYAFGVVLFEIISGREAMLGVLRNVTDSMSLTEMKGYVDPNLTDSYPCDCVYKLAMLAKLCVEDDPVLRPDMKQVVMSLSQILLSSIEWEATLSGNSRVFSDLVQGR